MISFRHSNKSLTFFPRFLSGLHQEHLIIVVSECNNNTQIYSNYWPAAQSYYIWLLQNIVPHCLKYLWKHTQRSILGYVICLVRFKHVLLWKGVKESENAAYILRPWLHFRMLYNCLEYSSISNYKNVWCICKIGIALSKMRCFSKMYLRRFWNLTGKTKI